VLTVDFSISTQHSPIKNSLAPRLLLEVIVQTIPQTDGILTSGGEGTASERCARLREYSARAPVRVAIMAGGGVNEEAFALFAKTGCVREIHVGRAARDGTNLEGPVSAARVRRLRDLADR